MSSFFTGVSIPEVKNKLTYEDQFLLIGSCFSEYIYDRFQKAIFRSESNPFGVLYNPSSIAICLRWLLSDQVFTEDDLVEYNGQYHSLLHQMKFSGDSSEDCLSKVNISLSHGRNALQKASVLILTFGTAQVYERDGNIVGNCHKIPNGFTERMLSVNEIVNEYTDLLAHPKLQGKRIIVTVSPYRYIKYGMHLNQLSKARLLMAIEQLPVEYFPAYEILLDELRDYRFYAPDMVHPSEVAIDYIWSKFSQTYFSDSTLLDMPAMENLSKAVLHRPVNPSAAQYDFFLQQIRTKAIEINQKYPWVQPYIDKHLD